MEINLQNIEDLIFFDRNLQELFPEFRPLFDQWKLGLRLPSLQLMGRQAIISLLNALTTEHIQKLEEYFGQAIVLNKLDNRLVHNYTSNLEEGLERQLCQFANFKEFSVYRNKEQIYISFWR